MAEIEVLKDENTISLESLNARIQEIEDSIGGLNPRNLAGIRASDLIKATVANMFGDGSDGDVEITGTTTLTRDMFYNYLTIVSGGILNPNGFRVSVKNDLIIKSGGYIKRNGNPGGNASEGSAGTGGAALASGSLPAGEDGKVGGLYGSPTGLPGTAGDDVAKSLGNAGSGGGGGGSSPDGSGGAGGNGGSQTGTVFNVPKSFIAAYLLLDIMPSISNLLGSAGSGSGGAGGSQSPSTGGPGGGSGSTGGFIEIFAKRIINEQEEGIQAKGGDGGNGMNGSAANSGGGGGGAGGSGGVILLIYGEKTGNGTVVATGGAKGLKGLGVGTGNNGSDGSDGLAGNIFNISTTQL